MKCSAPVCVAKSKLLPETFNGQQPTSRVRRHAPPTLTAILIAMMVLPRHTTVSLVRIRHKRLETSLDMLVLQVTISSVIGKL